MACIRSPLNGGELATLERLAQRVDRLTPYTRAPEHYHLEKSDIVEALKRITGALRLGHRLPKIEE